MSTTYQIFDVSEQIITENSITFEGARDFIANHWDTLDEDAPDHEIHADIMNTTTLDELNHFASGLDYIIELEGENK